MLANIAIRWLLTLLSLRPDLPWRMALSLPDYGRDATCAARGPRLLVMILVPLGQLFDVLGRPIRDFHAEMQAHLGQHFLDLVQRLAAEVRSAEHFRLGLLD